MNYTTSHEFSTMLNGITKDETDGTSTLLTESFELTLGCEEHPFTLHIPHNFGDRLRTKDIDAQSVGDWLHKILTAYNAAELNASIQGILFSCLMALESNHTGMQDYFKIQALMEAKPDAKADRSIFCEFMVLKNIAHGNFTMAEFFIKEMKKGLSKAMEKVFELGADGSEMGVVRESLSATDEGFKTKVSGTESFGSGPYNEVMMYLKSKNEYADELQRRLTGSWLSGADGLCFYDRQHYLHSVMLLAYAKWLEYAMNSTKDDTKMYDGLKAGWMESHGTTEEEFEEAYPGILATILEEGIYKMVPKFITTENCGCTKDLRDYITDDRKWDKFLPFGCDFFSGRDGSAKNFQMTWTDHSYFRTFVVHALNDITWDCPWSYGAIQDMEVIDVERVETTSE